MLKSFIKALAIVAGLAMPGLALAVGMGGINLTSALGEPLKLEVELDTASKAETNNLSVRLASPEMFKSAGLDYPYSLPKLKFKIETNPSSDRPYLIITSLQPINEPFVSLLVELSWPSGKLLREYTFLLDPPGYAADQPKAAEVKPVEPIAELESEISSVPEAGAVPETGSVPGVDSGLEMSAGEDAASGVMAAESDSLATEEKIASETPTDSAGAEADKAQGNISSGDITVKRGDTLHRIASLAKSSDVSVERMLVALYRVNAEKFNGKNMNRLQAGKILRMPDQSEVDQLTQAQAVKEIRIQVADWHAYRQRLAVASVAVTEQTPTQEASGKISASVTDQTPPAKESAKEVVRLSKGEAPGDHTAGGGKAKDTADDAQTQEEEAIAKGKTVAENKDRAALLEKNVKAMQRLLELKNQAAVPETKTDAGKLEVLPQATPAAATDAAEQAKPVAQAAMPSVQPSLLDEFLGEPLYRVATVVLLGLVALGVVLRQRAQRRKRRMFESDEGNTTGRITAPIVPSPETGDFTTTLVNVPAANPGSGAVASNSNAQVEEVDPISEADLFLNFGRDEQAEEILKDALIKNPAYHQVHLKLLSIYLNRRDVTAFSAIAQQLKDSGDAKSWEQASIMGLKLEPNNPMYGGSGKSAEVAQSVASLVVSKPEVMFDVGAAAAQSPIMDFDLGLATTKVAAVSKEQNFDSTLVLNAPMDFDVTGSRPVAAVQGAVSAETSSKELDDLIFDVTAGIAPAPSATEAVPKAAAPAEADMGLTFTLDIPAANKIEAAPVQVAAKPMLDFDMAEISLNLAQPAKPSSPFPSAADGKDEHWHDVATKLDLANAYKEMGDVAGAREILDEVVQEGDDQQRTAAEVLLKQL